MNIEEYYKLLNSASSSYVSILQKDFYEKSEYVDLFSKLYFKDFDIVNWVNKIKVNTILDFDYIGDLPTTNIPITLAEVEQISFNYENINIAKENTFQFFSESYYETIEAAENDLIKSYYVCHDDFIKRIDSMVLEGLPDYKSILRGKYVKELKVNVSLVFDVNSPYRKEIMNIQDYFFPEFYLIINKKKYQFWNALDVGSFLFWGIRIFGFFHNISKININGYTLKKDQPIIYRDTHIKKIILSNSINDIILYNKFIYLSADIFIHYFRVFEKWTIEVLVNKILGFEELHPE